MESLNFDKKTLKKFAVTMGIFFIGITVFILMKRRYIAKIPFTISAVFFLLAIFLPNILKPVYFLWMKLTFILGWVNTRVILIIVFYLIFTPVGLLMRLFGNDSLDLKIEKNRTSYWKKKIIKEFNPLDYERQF
jgi:hypothetical protein